MKSPLPAGTPIDMARMRSWVTEFGGYRHSVTERRIERWLDQFDLPDIDLAARLLDCVEFIPTERVASALKTGLNSLPGWSTQEGERSGAWRFAAFSASAGESGDVMLQRLRHAMNLAARRYNNLFVHRSELLSAGLGANDSVVLVDDFAGTGKQACDAWPMLSEYLPDGPKVHLLLVAARDRAIERIQAETDLLVQAEIVLSARDAVFDDACTRFSIAEKLRIKHYCDACVSLTAREFAKDGYLLVFGHTCPNNTLPVLHSSSGDWEGLFRRYD